MHDTLIYYESTSRLFIVHFDLDADRVRTERYAASDEWDMGAMGKAVKEWHDLDSVSA